MAMHSAPLIAVNNVPATSAWYQQLLGVRSDMEAAHPHRQEFDRVVDTHGRVIIAFHCWDAEPEVAIDRYFVNRDAATPGHGVLLTFVVDNLAGAESRAQSMGCNIIEKLHQLPDGSLAFWLCDPDGYVIQISNPPPAYKS